MTSVLSRKAQIPPFSYYIVENNGGYILTTLTVGDTYSLSGNTILGDRGKTVVIDGYIYRKVQVVTQSNGTIISEGQTGYICLNSDNAPLFDGDHQGISKLN
jgi:hypothetical protein